MKLAVTGCNGSVGQRVVLLALKEGHTVVGVDSTLVRDEAEYEKNEKFYFLQLDVKEYDEVVRALEGCEAVVHLAAFRSPGDYKVQTHNSNVVLSWNVLRAAAELGIKRVALASSCNVLSMVYSANPGFDYFPVDEEHPVAPDEPYGLSKLIGELQAETIARRYPEMQIASLRLSYSIPNLGFLENEDPSRTATDLWGYVQEDSGAKAFLLAVAGETFKNWKGHESFFIAAPEIRLVAKSFDSGDLRKKYWGTVKVLDGWDISGRRGFFNCSKAERMLGWVHERC